MKKIFGEQIMKNHNVINNLKFVFGHIKKNEKKLIVMSILSAVIYALSAYIMPILSKIIIDSVIAEKSVKFLIVSIIIMLVVQVLISDVSEYIFFQSWWRIIRARYSFEPLRLNQILSIRYDKLEKQETLNLAQKAAAATENNSNGIESFLRNLQAFLTSGFQLVIAMFLIVSLNPIVVLLMLIFAYIGYRITGNARKKDKELMWDILPQYERGRDYYKNISKDFSYGKDIRLFNMQKFILNKEKREAKMVHQIMKKSNNRWIKYSTINYFYFLMNEIVMYAWLVYAVLQGQIGIGDFSLYLMTMKTFFESVSAFLDSISKIKKDSYEVSDFRRFIELPEDNNGKCLILEKDIPVKIEFKNVSFRYPDQEENIINDISFQINESDRIAIVGYNGAGKSTIIKLLCRLYDPTDGKILINGEDIKQYKRSDCFRLFSPVFQDVNLFAFSVTENVTMKKQEETDHKRLVNAFTKADVTSLIDKLPKGPDTLLFKIMDKNGVNLSGGEKQKLSVARSIYKDAEIFIFDEPTASLDPIAEKEFYESIDEKVSRKPVIYISHRLSSTKFCNKIFLLEHGKIIERGTHEELMNYNGEYAKIYTLQAGYYKSNKVSGGEQESEQA